MAAGGARWTAGPALPMNGAYQTGAVLDGKVYSIGGDTFDGTSLFPYADVLMLASANLGAGWQAKASLPLPSSGSPGCDESRAFGFDSSSGWALAGKVVLAGCGQWNATNTALPDSFLYDAAGNSWTTFAALIQARRNHAGAFIVAPDGLSGKMWVGGGYIPGAANTGTDTTETYTISFSAPTAVGLDDFRPAAAQPAAVGPGPGDAQTTPRCAARLRSLFTARRHPAARNRINEAQPRARAAPCCFQDFCSPGLTRQKWHGMLPITLPCRHSLRL